MRSDGLNLAINVRKCLEERLPGLELTIGDNYWDNALWHARIIGCIAEAGIRNGFRIELGRRFMQRKRTKKIDFSGFLKRYCALYRKYKFGSWSSFSSDSSTEIDVIYFNPKASSTVALCEYENKQAEVAENIIKFRALAGFDPKRFDPELCILGFWSSSIKYVEMSLQELQKLVKMANNREKARFQQKEEYDLPPLRSWWLLFALFKDASAFMVKCKSVILKKLGNKAEEKEFDVGHTVH